MTHAEALELARFGSESSRLPGQVSQRLRRTALTGFGTVSRWLQAQVILALAEGGADGIWL